MGRNNSENVCRDCGDHLGAGYLCDDCDRVTVDHPLIGEMVTLDNGGEYEVIEHRPEDGTVVVELNEPTTSRYSESHVVSANEVGLPEA